MTSPKPDKDFVPVTKRGVFYEESALIGERGSWVWECRCGEWRRMNVRENAEVSLREHREKCRG